MAIFLLLAFVGVVLVGLGYTQSAAVRKTLDELYESRFVRESLRVLLTTLLALIVLWSAAVYFSYRWLYVRLIEQGVNVWLSNAIALGLGAAVFFGLPFVASLRRSDRTKGYGMLWAAAIAASLVLALASSGKQDSIPQPPASNPSQNLGNPTSIGTDIPKARGSTPYAGEQPRVGGKPTLKLSRISRPFRFGGSSTGKKLETGIWEPREYYELAASDWPAPGRNDQCEFGIVRIIVEDTEGSGIGSGFVVEEDGTIVTNYHVIEGCHKAAVVFSDGTEIPVRGILRLEPKKDIAIITINYATAKLIPLIPFKLAEQLPQEGETVVSFGGKSDSLLKSISEGNISGIRNSQEVAETGAVVDGTWIQTTSDISPGNSGGPLVNVEGEVVGMNTMTVNLGPRRFNFAISAQDIAAEVVKAKSAQLVPLTPMAVPRVCKSLGARASRE